MPDQLAVALIAVGWAGAIGAAGFALAYLTRRRSLRWSLALVAIVAVAAVVAGVIGTANAMFLSGHDFGVVLLVCLVAGVVAIGVAVAVSALVVRSSRKLTRRAQEFGETGAYVGADVGPVEFQDLSAELTRASARLRASRDRERQLESSRRELVAWVSHDLRSPLAGLRAMTEALEDGMVDDPARYYSRMRAEVDRMVRMVDDLFELSRIHAGVLQLSLERVSLADVVSEAIAGADPIARAANVRLGGEVGQDVIAYADPAGLSRVVTNLVTNAIRHTPADGAVSITGQHVGDAVELAVSDGCGGIPEDDLARVFDLAWRGSAARTPPVGDRDLYGTGAGLGLAIVKGIVEAHHGAVLVHNHPPGCRFLVTLPTPV
ncbi:MAG: HAMP domain-containing sensor histidine kinase [Microlunatus sp.]